MSLKAVYDAWLRLNQKSQDWQGLLADAGLLINAKTPADFLAALTKPIKINRDVPGFEDFDLDGTRGIEGGDPGRSLLYHAFASPKAVSYRGTKLDIFPTLEEIIALENLIYQEAHATWNSLHKKARDLSGPDEPPEIGVVVFSYDYQTAERTVHRKNADLCFARTGVARVGTHPEYFSTRDRGWFTFNDEDKPFTIRVIPARYGAFLAVRLKGDPDKFGPKYFRRTNQANEINKPKEQEPGDSERRFWVPLHKLFSGPDCIKDCPNLAVHFNSDHVNEKLRRVHLELHRRGMEAHQGPKLEKYPFRFVSGIAGLVIKGDSAIVVPDPQHLVKAADLNGKPLTLSVPPDPSLFLTSFRIRPDDNKHYPCPKYVNCRTMVHGGKTTNLNTLPEMFAVLHQGGFEALHYVDFTGDGYVSVKITGCKELEKLRSVSAYSIVAQPDFLPFVDQSDLYDWWLNIFPKELRDYSWGSDGDDPAPLSQSRLSANFATHPNIFQESDDTVTATVAMPRQRQGNDHPIDPQLDQPIPNSYLPDDASGDFAPGWDVAISTTNRLDHLAIYGMSSPFPEDARLCSAFGASWPAATPDITNWFPSEGYFAVAPLGNPAAGWDQTILPYTPFPSGTVADYANPGYSDWVQVALQGKLDLVRLKNMTLRAYTTRVHAMARFYKAMGATTDEARSRYAIIYFSPQPKLDAIMLQAIKSAHPTQFSVADAFRIRYLMETGRSVNSFDFRRLALETAMTFNAFISPQSILVTNDDENWQEKS